MIRLMLVSSLPKALVATQVKRAESARSVLLMLIVERTPSVTISSLIPSSILTIEENRQN